MMTAAKPIRLLVADDRPLVREALGSATSFVAVAVEGGRDEILSAVRTEQPDVVILGAAGARSAELAQAVLMTRPETAVLVLVSSEQDPEVIEALGAGAAGFLTLSMPVDEIAGRIEAAAAHQTILSAEFAAQMLARLQGKRHTEIRRAKPQLTEREHEILKLLTTGLGNAEIAARLGVSPNTVKNHLYSIYRKLGVSSRNQAFAAVAELGIAV